MWIDELEVGYVAKATEEQDMGMGQESSGSMGIGELEAKATEERKRKESSGSMGIDELEVGGEGWGGGVRGKGCKRWLLAAEEMPDSVLRPCQIFQKALAAEMVKSGTIPEIRGMKLTELPGFMYAELLQISRPEFSWQFREPACADAAAFIKLCLTGQNPAIFGTLDGAQEAALVPERLMDFLRGCVDWHEYLLDFGDLSPESMGPPLTLAFLEANLDRLKTLKHELGPADEDEDAYCKDLEMQLLAPYPSEHKVTVTNGLTAYYLLLLHVSESKRLGGKDWQGRCLPLQTIRNACHLMAHSVLAAMFTAADGPWRLRCRQEHVAEAHFSRLKKSWRGTPSLLNAIYSGQLEHMRACREARNFQFSAVSPATPVDTRLAGELSSQCFRDACMFQASISKSRRAENISQDEENELESDDIYEEVILNDDEEEADDPRDEQAADAVNVKQELLSLAGQLDPERPEHDAALALVPTTAAEPPAAPVSMQTGPGDAATSCANKVPVDAFSQQTWPADAKLNIANVMMRLRDLPPFQKPPTSETALTLVTARMEAMREPLQDFCQEVLLQGALLSKAQITRNCEHSPTQWNILQHELCLARQAAALSGQRQSRSQTWTQTQEVIHCKSGDTTQSGTVHRVTAFGSFGLDQIVLFVKPDQSVGIALTLTTFRGAVLTGKHATRRLKVCRHAACPMPVGLCKAVRVLELVQACRSPVAIATKHAWVGSLLNPISVIEPQCIVAQIKPMNVDHGSSRVTVRFSDDALAAKNTFVEKRAWEDTAAMQTIAKEPPSTVSKLEGLTLKHFTHTSAAKHIPIFLQNLPALYQKAALPLLDASGCFCLSTKSTKQNKQIKWSEVVARAPACYDVILAGQASAQYSRAILTDLRRLLPSKDSGLTQVSAFVQKVDELAIPWLPLTCEVVGLFAKDEKDAMCGDVRNDFVKENPNMEENLLNMYNYLMDRLRDNLHVCLCFSPVNAKFPIRAQKFPAVFTVNINWFMPWPEAALVAVSSAFLSTYKLDCSESDKGRLFALTGSFQALTRDLCDVYYSRMRKNVYVTPKSFLCLIDFYKVLYAIKYEEINVQERSVNVGLQKLKEASEFVEKLKVELKEQDVVLRAEEKKTTALLEKVMAEKAKADKKAEQVNAQKADCQAEADKINGEKAEAQIELDKALPFLHEAESACNSITKKDITEIKTNNKPVDIIKLTFDGLQILQSKSVISVKDVESGAGG
ncbi:Dnah5 [Symbiodinium sp. CCMP2592]|nr:Dnah5 [Symbiodinium sp. CCMP2592]